MLWDDSLAPSTEPRVNKTWLDLSCKMWYTWRAYPKMWNSWYVLQPTICGDACDCVMSCIWRRPWELLGAVGEGLGTELKAVDLVKLQLESLFGLKETKSEWWSCRTSIDCPENCWRTLSWGKEETKLEGGSWTVEPIHPNGWVLDGLFLFYPLPNSIKFSLVLFLTWGVRLQQVHEHCSYTVDFLPANHFVVKVVYFLAFLEHYLSFDTWEWLSLVFRHFFIHLIIKKSTHRQALMP